MKANASVCRSIISVVINMGVTEWQPFMAILNDFQNFNDNISTLKQFQEKYHTTISLADSVHDANTGISQEIFSLSDLNKETSE